MILHLYQKISLLKIKDATKESPFSTKIKYILLTHFHKELIFGKQQSHVNQKNSHNVVQLNPVEDKYYLLTPYPTIMQPLKKNFPKLTFKHTFNIVCNHFDFFKLCIILIAGTLELLIVLLIIFCNFFVIFHSLSQTYINFAKIFDHLLRYDNSVTI